MSDKWPCIECGRLIGKWDKVCKYCGEKQFGDNDEYYPTDESMELAARLLGTGQKHKEPKQKGFSDEEILALGLYPKDEGYKMSLISKILNKR